MKLVIEFVMSMAGDKMIMHFVLETGHGHTLLGHWHLVTSFVDSPILSPWRIQTKEVDAVSRKRMDLSGLQEIFTG